MRIEAYLNDRYAFKDHPRNLLPSQVFFPPPTEASEGQSIWRMDIGPEAIFAANQAVAALYSHIGLSADMLVGHSTGEYSALYAAGVTRTHLPAGLGEELWRHGDRKGYRTKLATPARHFLQRWAEVSPRVPLFFERFMMTSMFLSLSFVPTSSGMFCSWVPLWRRCGSPWHVTAFVCIQALNPATIVLAT